ncbi:MAG: MFS transporter [Candidatus Limnocylindrales bacterium]
MLIAGIVLGFVLGLLLRGRPARLIDAELGWPAALFGAVVLRFGTELAIRNGYQLASDFRLPLYAAAFGLLLAALWHNRGLPGMLVVLVGATANATAIIANGGWMPVWGPSLALAGFSTADLVPTFHVLLPQTLGLEFLRMAGPFGDLLPVPLPYLANVASVGDIFISAGLGLFVLATMLRPTAREASAADRAAGLAGTSAGTLTISPVHLGRPVPTARYGGSLAAGTGLEAAISAAGAFTLDRPVLLGGASGATPATQTAAAVAAQAGGAFTAGRAEGALPIGARITEHPYVRLALDARFAAFWIGQTISLFGDRLHQVALAVLVYGLTNSPLATGLVFLTAALPNLFISPIAGTFVDRWDLRRTMVLSDVLRAGIVLLIPIAATRDVRLVFPLVFLVTTVSVFFRPAKAAAVPLMVHREDLMAANGATWTGETLADILGYPLAGVFVAFLGSSLGVAFWADAATYGISALLLLGIAIPRILKPPGPLEGSALRRFGGELRDGWRFLRGAPSLYQNTLISAVAQVSIGATIALGVVYARDVLDGSIVAYPANFTLIEAAIGVGNLAGGLVVGAIGARFSKGRLIVGGMIVMGVSIALLGATGNLFLALAGSLGYGVANLVYVIPTQTLFAELTPPGMMGRVVAFRSSLVFGALTLAMAVAGALAETLPAGLVITAFGLVTVGAGIVAGLLPAVRRS